MGLPGADGALMLSLIARNDFSRFREGRGPTGAKSDVCLEFGVRSGVFPTEFSK